MKTQWWWFSPENQDLWKSENLTKRSSCFFFSSTFLVYSITDVVTVLRLLSRERVRDCPPVAGAPFDDTLRKNPATFTCRGGHRVWPGGNKNKKPPLMRRLNRSKHTENKVPPQWVSTGLSLFFYAGLSPWTRCLSLTLTRLRFINKLLLCVQAIPASSWRPLPSPTPPQPLCKAPSWLERLPPRSGPASQSERTKIARGMDIFFVVESEIPKLDWT